MKVQRSISVDRPPDDLYAYWRKLENLAQIAPGETVVSAEGKTRSHWVTKAPGGRTFAWDAEITHDEPPREIAWHSLPDADVTNAGRVQFVPLDRHRTQVRLTIEYTPPGGLLGRIVGRVAQRHVESEIDSGLQRIKHELEHSAS